MTNIKLIYVNGDYTYTRVNADCTESEIIDYYNFNNMLNVDINKQIKEIEIEVNPAGLIGCSARTIIYQFVYDESAKCYLYQ